MALLPWESGPGSSSGPKQGRNSRTHSAKRSAHSEIYSLRGNRTLIPTQPLGWRGQDRGSGGPKRARATRQAPNSFPGYPLQPGKNPLQDERTGFISDLKISEPNRRIQGKNHYLFGNPKPRSCPRHGIALEFPVFSAIIGNKRIFPSTKLEMVPFGQ